MTSNATDPHSNRLKAGGLTEWMPTGRYGHVRRLFVTAEIRGLLEGTDTRAGFAPNEATLRADQYLAGFPMHVGRGLPPKKLKRSQQPVLEQLGNLPEIWALCIRKPDAGWRLFGRFMDKDLLVLMLPFDRHELNGQATYQAKAAGVIPAWNNPFAGMAPHTGTNLSDYMTGVVIDAY